MGRKRELRELDQAWAAPDQRVVGVIAWGGFGKTTLVRQWLYLHKDEWPDLAPDAIYWHSFQTAGDLDLFFVDLVTYFAGKPPALENFKTSYQKLTALRQAIGERRFLLVLDGLEPLQNPTRGDRFGTARELLLGALLREIAAGRMGQGLCIVTSRLPLRDLAGSQDRAYRVIALEDRLLSLPESLLILKWEGVSQGTEADRRKLVELAGRHPLALKMLGNLVDKHHAGNAAGWRQLHEALKPLPGNEQRYHLWRIFRWYDDVLTFSGLWVADGTLLSIKRFRHGSGLALAIQTDNKPPVASVVVPKRVRLGMPGGFKGAVDFGRAREIVITAEGALEIQMQPAGDTSRLFRPEIPIRTLSVIEFPQQEGASFRPYSTLRKSVLYLEDLAARKHRLRQGEHLRLEMTTGMLRVFEIGLSGIRLELSARVKTLALGSQNLMPWWLEYLKAQSEWTLFVGTTIFLFGFVLDLLRWIGALG